MQARSILITGASNGIGAALALRLAQPGRALALVGRDPVRLEAVASTCRRQGATCHVAAMDLRDRLALSGFVERFDREHGLDGAIFSAGILDGRRQGDAVESREVAREVLDVNLMSAIDAVHMVLPLLRARRRGEIVLIASLASMIPLPDAPAYSASKAGLLAYGLALREAVRPEGLRVVVACPGYVATAMAGRHHGPRPGEISAERAAQLILSGVSRNQAVIGFPLLPYWLVLLSRFAPEAVRRHFQRHERFHVDPGSPTPDP